MDWYEGGKHDGRVYRVVINDHKQYSIWPTTMDLPRGWSDTGKTGTKEECVDYMREIWPGLDPLKDRDE